MPGDPAGEPLTHADELHEAVNGCPPVFRAQKFPRAISLSPAFSSSASASSRLSVKFPLKLLEPFSVVGLQPGQLVNVCPVRKDRRVEPIGRRWSRSGVIRAILVLSVALLAGCTHGSAPMAVSAPIQKRLLAIADTDARSCSGPAKHVEVARSTRATANRVATGDVGQVGDERPVWVLLITGGPFNCPHTGPSGASLPPASDQIIFLDASTFKPTDGGFGGHDTLDGLGPIATLR